MGFEEGQGDKCIADHAYKIPRSSDGVLLDSACRAQIYSVSILCHIEYVVDISKQALGQWIVLVVGEKDFQWFEGGDLPG